ncbi:hypothetical protein ACW14Y_22680 [Kitasatospora sp. cg17-2]
MATRKGKQRRLSDQSRTVTATSAKTPGTLSAAKEGTPEDLRAHAVRQLSGVGNRRIELASELADLDSALRPLILEAVAAGVPYRRIEELTGVSRASVTRWTRQAASG